MNEAWNQDEVNALDVICPTCRADRLRAWEELSEEERQIIIQRPSPDIPSLEHRRQCHLWCRHCALEYCSQRTPLHI